MPVEELKQLLSRIDENGIVYIVDSNGEKHYFNELNISVYYDALIIFI